MAKSKPKKSTKFETPRLEVRMQRISQRAHTFKDRRKEASRKACRKGSY
jgi:hypothetical protein